jgi:hypothetical protein
MAKAHIWERTNERIDRIKSDIRGLITWAQDDEEHARDNNALSTAADDRRRQRNLKKALAILDNCYR